MKTTESERLTNTKRTGVGEKNRKDKRQNISVWVSQPSCTALLCWGQLAHKLLGAEEEEVGDLLCSRHELSYCCSNRVTAREERRDFVSAKSRGREK